uniref:Retrotransposon gag domain-containing protein n=1 Tax=Cajanus cajan TaxID=3821 RepID=A0A151S9Q9_CAJCA|nr:hypothetical protein KK1_026561 [Cajanus cajan]
MAEIKNSVIENGDNKFQNAGELQNVHSAYRLNGKNYLKWSQLIKTILKAKGKVSHLIGDAPTEGDAKFKSWGEDSMIMAWLWNSMVSETSNTCMFLNSTKAIWIAIDETYSKAKDAAQIYEVKVKTMAAKQGTKTVTEYANQLKSLWMELDHYRVIKAKCYKDSAILRQYIEQGRVHDFLVGLNQEYDQVKIQILGKKKVPRLNEVVAIIRSEQSKRSLRLETPTIDSSAMIVKGAITMVAEQKKTGLLPNGEKKNEGVWCTYCNKPRHMRDKCWKLHGKPQSKDWGHKGSPPRRGAQVHVATSLVSQEGPIQLNHQELERVRSFLSKLEKPTRMCSLTYSGKFPFSFGFNVSNTHYRF